MPVGEAGEILDCLVLRGVLLSWRVMDVKWLRLSEVKLTLSECEKLLFKPKESAGRNGR